MPPPTDQVFPFPKRSETCGARPPNAPVRLIAGKKLAIATPTFALAATSCCSAWRMSGRRRSRSDGSPAGTSGGRKKLVVESGAARDRPRIAPQEEGDRVLLGRDLPLEVRDVGCGRGERGRGAGGIERGAGATLEPPVEQVVGPLKRLLCPPGDLELQVERPKLEVVRGDTGDEREENAAARLLRGQVLGERFLVQASDASPQIDLPGEAEVDVVQVRRRRWKTAAGGRAAARPLALRLQLRKEFRPGDAGAGPRFLDAPRREPDVVRVPDRLADQ